MFYYMTNLQCRRSPTHADLRWTATLKRFYASIFMMFASDVPRGDQTLV